MFSHLSLFLPRLQVHRYSVPFTFPAIRLYAEQLSELLAIFAASKSEKKIKKSR